MMTLFTRKGMFFLRSHERTRFKPLDESMGRRTRELVFMSLFTDIKLVTVGLYVCVDSILEILTKMTITFDYRIIGRNIINQMKDDETCYRTIYQLFRES